MAAKETSDNIEFDIDEAASWLNPSWLNLGTSSEFSSWTHARDLREQNKKLRRIYEESGREDYGLDVKPPDFSAAAKAAAASELMKKRVTVALELRNKHVNMIRKGHQLKGKNLKYTDVPKFEVIDGTKLTTPFFTIRSWKWSVKWAHPVAWTCAFWLILQAVWLRTSKALKTQFMRLLTNWLLLLLMNKNMAHRQ
jgi:hypothetical protein